MSSWNLDAHRLGSGRICSVFFLRFPSQKGSDVSHEFVTGLGLGLAGDGGLPVGAQAMLL